MAARLVGAGGLAVVVILWWLATRGAAESRLISPVILPSPAEVVESVPALFKERALVQSVAATLRRVLVGFGLAALVGVPLGILAGAWRVIAAAGAPSRSSAATCRSRRSFRSRSSGSASTRRRR